MEINISSYKFSWKWLWFLECQLVAHYKPLSLPHWRSDECNDFFNMLSGK